MENIPRVGLGTAGVARKETSTLIYEALKCGYRHIDCAAYYGNEKEVGEGICQALDEGIVKREDFWITSKVWNDMHEEKLVHQSCERTLKDLGVDYLDLFLVHWPVALSSKGDTVLRIPLSHTWKAMEALADAGRAKRIGVSNFDIQLLHDLLSYCRIRPYSNQVESHVYLAQDNLLQYCEREKIYLTAYSPLGNPSAPRAGHDVPILLDDPVVAKIAASHNRTPAQVVLRWQLERSPWTVVIPRTSKVERLTENIDVLSFKLTQGDMTELKHRNRNSRIITAAAPFNVFMY